MPIISILGKGKQEDQVFKPRTGEMAQQFRALVAFPEFLGSVPSIETRTKQNSCQQNLRSQKHCPQALLMAEMPTGRWKRLYFLLLEAALPLVGPCGAGLCQPFLHAGALGVCEVNIVLLFLLCDSLL